jgi:YVTN family beta-propeller protein
LQIAHRAAIAATAAVALGLVGLGAAPAQAGTTAAGRLVYLANQGSDSVTGYDPVTGTTAMTASLAAEPYGLALAPGGATLYATQAAPSWSGSDAGFLVVINAATGAVRTTVPVGGDPEGLAVSPSGNIVYVANSADGTVTVINAVTDTVTATVSVGGMPAWITVSSNGNSVYVPTFTGGTVDVISAASNTVTSVLSDDLVQPVDAVLSQDGALAYVADFYSDDVAVFSTATGQLLATIPVGMAPFALATSPNGGSIYTADQGDGSVYTINTVSDKVTSTVGIGAAPQDRYGDGPLGITTSADGSTVYVTTSAGPASAYAISTSTGAVTALNDGYVAAGITTLPLPQVTGVSPSGGAPAGGSQVTVTGSGFTGASAVDFGAVAATAFTVNSATSITATVPPGAAGIVDVTVTDAAGASLTGRADQYGYQVAPAITGVSPLEVLATGGSVTLTGTGLNGPVTENLGSTSTATFFNESATSLTVSVPPGTPGSTLSITVTNSVGISNTVSIRYISPHVPINPVQSRVARNQG